MLFHFDFRISEMRDRERLLRLDAERHRLFRLLPRRGLRLRLGESLMRLGRLVAGEAAGSPMNAPTPKLRLG